MNKRIAKILAISLKTNAIKLDDENWYSVSSEVAKILDRLERNETYEFTFDTNNKIIFVSPKKSEEAEEEKVDEKEKFILKLSALRNTTNFINTIALVSPTYLAENFKKEDPFDYLKRKTEEILEWLRK